VVKIRAEIFSGNRTDTATTGKVAEILSQLLRREFVKLGFPGSAVTNVEISSGGTLVRVETNSGYLEATHPDQYGAVLESEHAVGPSEKIDDLISDPTPSKLQQSRRPLRMSGRKSWPKHWLP
jgi:hypothetical protein